MTFLTTSIGSPFMWGIFALIVLIMLALDLFVFGGGKEHKVSFKEAATWSSIWVALSFAFAGWLYFYLSANSGPSIAAVSTMEFITGYLLEKSLAVDNVFVWMMVFAYFKIPLELQRRVLLYGIVGAIFLRVTMIFAGAALIQQFHWVLYIFGAFLLFTGIKMWLSHDEEEDSLGNNKLLSLLKSKLKVTETLHGDKFSIMQNGVRMFTPLFLALVIVEISDIIFAVDSIPAVFAVTTDPFIVLTSNIFAILGLRAMYFLIAGMADRFSLLKYGLSAVLVFIGIKMLLMDIYKIPIGFSLAVVATFIGISVWLSLRKEAKSKDAS